MFYAKILSDKYQDPIVAANTNQPLNFEIQAFETKAARQAAIDAAWEAGGNGIPCTRRTVEGYYGRNFEGFYDPDRGAFRITYQDGSW